MVVLGRSNPRGRPASSSRATLCLHHRGGTAPLILLQVTAHLLLHVSDITADPLGKPVQLRRLIPAVLQIVPMAASHQLQLLDLVSQSRKMGMRWSN